MTSPASPFVSPDHWSYRVLKRLDYARVLPRGADVARRSMPQEEIAALLERTEHPRAQRYLQRFRSEFSASKMFDVSISGGYHAAVNQYAPGIGYDTTDWRGAEAVADVSEPFAATRLAFAVTDWLALAVARETARLQEAQLVAAHRILGAWAGLRQLGFATGEGGGLVVNRNELAGGGVFLTRAVRLPLLGTSRFEMHLGRIDNVLNLNGTQRDVEPWFWAARGSFEPFQNLRVGINRGMMFGGEGNLRVTFSRVAENLIGIYTDDGESSFANQVISVDFRLHVPGLPVTAYLDWGADDAAGGWWDVPAILAGLELVHIDSTFDASVGIEHLQFSATCCSNSIWYRNAWFRGSWADGEQALGHPLGGHGHEWRVFANGGLLHERVIAHAALFARRRRNENIFTPAWLGESLGLRAGTDIAVRSSTRLLFDLEAESGADDWSSSRLSAAIRHRF